MPKRLAKKSIGSIPNSRFRCFLNASRNGLDNGDDSCGAPLECPKECMCQGGVVDCRGQNLSEIPYNIPEYATQM